MFGPPAAPPPPTYPGEVPVSNDPFLSHSAPVGPSRKPRPAPQEMANVASDAFMIREQNRTASVPKRQNFPTIKVNIISASNLRAADWMTGKSDPYVICEIPRKSRSQFRTKTIDRNLNPVWNEYGHPLPGWVPGDPIRFRVFDADMLHTDDPLGEATLQSPIFYPNGWRGELSLKDDTHTDVTGSTLLVQIEVFGVTAGDRFEMGLMRAEDKVREMEHGLEDCVGATAALPGLFIDQIEYVVGEGDPERKHETLWTYILVPWTVFMWILLVWLVLRHFTVMATTLLTAISFAVCIGVIVSGIAYHRGEKSIPFSTMGVLCLIAVVAGVWSGQHGWENCWRQYWWTITGIGYTGNTASTPAASRIDAAWIGFTGSDAGDTSMKTMAGTSVDTFRAAGYRHEGNWYCAAPILNPKLVSDTIWTRVEYWAIGINCCGNFQSFTCDASREYQGGYGVVMVDEGMPCAGCHNDLFRKASQKAEGVFNLVTSPGARFVRFVRNPSSFRNEYLFLCLANILGSMLVSLFVFSLLGKLCHFKGIGKKGRMPNFNWKVLTGKEPFLV